MSAGHNEDKGGHGTQATMTHTGKSAGHHNDNNDKDVMGYALPRRENDQFELVWQSVTLLIV
jgi:uncharacterized protein with PIN domain